MSRLTSLIMSRLHFETSSARNYLFRFFLSNTLKSVLTFYRIQRVENQHKKVSFCRRSYKHGRRTFFIFSYSLVLATKQWPHHSNQKGTHCLSFCCILSWAVPQKSSINPKLRCINYLDIMWNKISNLLNLTELNNRKF